MVARVCVQYSWIVLHTYGHFYPQIDGHRIYNSDSTRPFFVLVHLTYTKAVDLRTRGDQLLLNVAVLCSWHHSSHTFIHPRLRWLLQPLQQYKVYCGRGFYFSREGFTPELNIDCFYHNGFKFWIKQDFLPFLMNFRHFT